MKIKFKHIMLTFGIVIILMVGIGLTAQLSLPREEYINSFYNHGLGICVIWTFLVGIVVFLIKVCKES